MKNFNRDDRSGGSRGGRRGDFGNNRGQRPEMHQVTCSDCGKDCEVPFRPSGDRPVYCNTCFEKHGSSNSDRAPRKDFQRGGFENKRMFDATCAKCGKKCEVPFRPTGDKPVYCSQCFDKGGNTSGKAPDQFKQQFEILNSKLDRILKALNQTESTQTPKAEKKELEAKKNKTEKTSAKPIAKKTKAKKKK